jgi:hypothetical protein
VDRVGRGHIRIKRASGQKAAKPAAALALIGRTGD